LVYCRDIQKIPLFGLPYIGIEAEMTSDAAKEWDKKNNCKDTVYAIELIA